MKLSDYIFSFFEKKEIKHAFTLAGGGIMHLIDSLGRSQVKEVCLHHEQAASIAAQAYAMYQDHPALCLVTTGPGGTNALTGTAAAFTDSTPVFYMSGQVKRADFADLRGVRQFGAQEIGIVPMAKPVTKYAVTVMQPERIAYELEKAWYLMTTGRKGPVWLDIPLDVQAAEIDVDSLEHFSVEHFIEEKKESKQDAFTEKELKDAAKQVTELLLQAKRPIILVGQGMVSAGSAPVVHEIVELTGIPVLATWRALDFMGSAEKGFYGSPGLQAPRYSNLILQSCDCLIVLGSRLDNMITAFSEEHFAFLAKKVIVDIDVFEIRKLAMAEVLPVIADVYDFSEALLLVLKKEDVNFKSRYRDWIERCETVKQKYPLLSEKQPKKTEGINLYRITDEVSKQAEVSDVVVISSTSRCNTAGHMAFCHKRGQKTISSMGMGSMGFALPSVVGAWFASEGARLVMFEGDGSLQLNIQELQTLVHHQIEAKLFIFSNSGYAAIATMQDRNFHGFHVGCDAESGVTMPDTKKIAEAYGISYRSICRDDEIEEKVTEVMQKKGLVICECFGSILFDEIPKCISSVDASGKRVSAALENPYPFLGDTEQKEIFDFLKGE